MDSRGVLFKEGGCYFHPFVPLAECVMYHVHCRGWLKVKGVVVVVRVVVCDEGCKMGVVVYVKDCGRVE